MVFLDERTYCCGKRVIIMYPDKNGHIGTNALQEHRCYPYNHYNWGSTMPRAKDNEHGERE